MTIYSIDTSSVIAAWVEHYPKDRFPSVWTRIDDLAQSGRLLASPFVLDELERMDDGAAEWCKASGIVVPVDQDIQVSVSQILAHHPNLVDLRKSRSMADPWVIALAQSRSGVVVTQENRSTNPSTKPKIPDVCAALNISCVRFLEVFRSEGWII